MLKSKRDAHARQINIAHQLSGTHDDYGVVINKFINITAFSDKIKCYQPDRNYHPEKCSHLNFLGFSQVVLMIMHLHMLKDVIKQPSLGLDLNPPENFLPSQFNIENENDEPLGAQIKSHFLEISHGVDFDMIEGKIAYAQKHLLSSRPNGAKQLQQIIPQIERLALSIAKHDEVGAVVDDAEYESFKEAMQAFAKTFKLMVNQVTDILDRKNASHL